MPLHHAAHLNKLESPITLTPHLVVRHAALAIDFYRRAFGAEEVLRLTGPENEIVHAEMRIGASSLYLNEESPIDEARSPESLGGAPASLHLYVADVDKAFARAVSAGAIPVTRVADMFWGDRYGSVRDPFGYEWALATHREAVTPAEVRARAKQLFAHAHEAEAEPETASARL